MKAKMVSELEELGKVLFEGDYSVGSMTGDKIQSLGLGEPAVQSSEPLSSMRPSLS